MLDKGMIRGVSDDSTGIGIWEIQIVCEIAGVLFTVVLEGLLGRRQCFISYATIIFIVSMLCSMMEGAPNKLVNFDTKYQMEKIGRDVICFFFGPIKSLLILFTLSVYPTSMR